MDHRKDFQWLVLESLGIKDAEAVDGPPPALDLHCWRLQPL